MTWMVRVLVAQRAFYNSPEGSVKPNGILTLAFRFYASCWLNDSKVPEQRQSIKSTSPERAVRHASSTVSNEDDEIDIDAPTPWHPSVRDG
jgi:hypothetical protein